MRKRSVIISAIVLSALALTGCASNGGTVSGRPDAGVVRVANVEPQNPLVPGNTNEAAGGVIIGQLFAGLIYYDAKGVSHNDVAQSITTEDSQNYDITLKPGQTFSDGEPITASSFVEAWNYTATLSNAQKRADSFQNVQGYNDTVDSTLTGLNVVSDTEFTVALTSPVADFVQQLGTSAFYPLPASAFTDMKAFGQNPVGNGPYKFASSHAWKHNEQLELVVNKAYSGPRKPVNDGLTFVVYSALDAAYKDVQAGNLDLLYQVPNSAIGTYASDFPDTSVSQPAAIQQGFFIPQTLAHFSGEEGALRRAAISLSINRQEIATVIFGGTRTPSTDFTAPTVAGYQKNLPGSEVFAYNPKKAKELWAQADAITPWSGTFSLAYNADGGHRDWVDAVSNNIKNTLGIPAQGVPVPTFGQLRDEITSRTIGSAFRFTLPAEYPGLYPFLGPVFATDARANDGDYSNPDFDALLKKGLSESDPSAANADFARAQQILFADLPQIPLWYQNATAVWSDALSDVALGWDSFPIFTDIVKD